MRHLERTHGISSTSMHEHFKRSNYVLMYEVASKMAADIHTKGFKNPLAWKRACVLINLLDPGDLGTKELSDMVKPTTDVDTTVRQVFQYRTNEIPNFPYTETPILPPEVYQKGFSAKEQVQQLPGMDPILVVKTPVYFRKRPPGIFMAKDYLRSTWILVHGKWEILRTKPLYWNNKIGLIVGLKELVFNTIPSIQSHQLLKQQITVVRQECDVVLRLQKPASDRRSCSPARLRRRSPASKEST